VGTEELVITEIVLGVLNPQEFIAHTEIKPLAEPIVVVIAVESELPIHVGGKDQL